MDELKRPGVIGGKIRTMTNTQHGRVLQLIVEQAHDVALAIFVERGCRFVEKDPARFPAPRANSRRIHVKEKPRDRRGV